MLLDYSEDTRRNLKFGRDPTKRKVDFRTHHFKKANLREKVAKMARLLALEESSSQEDR